VLWTIAWSIADFTHDRHRTVDDIRTAVAPDTAKPEPFFEAVESLQAPALIVLMSARGRRSTQADANRFAAGGELTPLAPLQGCRPARRRLSPPRSCPSATLR
jgi:tRNA G37 N-methylase TrmD